MRKIACLVTMLCLGACAGVGREVEVQAPLPTIAGVDLARYMGDWYVVAAIPASYEKDAHNWLLNYQLDRERRVVAEGVFRQGSFDGPIRKLSLLNTVVDPGVNSHWNQALAPWGMGTPWPVEPEYRIAYVSDDYTRAIVARSQRDHVWVLSRSREIADADYERLKHRVALMGYDVEKLERVPQRW